MRTEYVISIYVVSDKDADVVKKDVNHMLEHLAQDIDVNDYLVEPLTFLE